MTSYHDNACKHHYWLIQWLSLQCGMKLIYYKGHVIRVQKLIIKCFKKKKKKLKSAETACRV